MCFYIALEVCLVLSLVNEKATFSYELWGSDVYFVGFLLLQFLYSITTVLQFVFYVNGDNILNKWLSLIDITGGPLADHKMTIW